MDYEKKEKIVSGLILVIFLCAIALHYLLSPWGFYRVTADSEANARRNLVETAQQWLGINEADGSHRRVLDIYNAQETLPLGYVVQDSHPSPSENPLLSSGNLNSNNQLMNPNLSIKPAIFSEANRRIRSSSKETKNTEEPGSP